MTRKQIQLLAIVILTILNVFAYLFVTGAFLDQPIEIPLPSVPVVRAQAYEEMPTTTPSVFVYSEEPSGGVFEPTAPTREIITLHCNITVHGNPRADSKVLYILFRGAYIVPREEYNGWLMIQPAHWIEKEDLNCGGNYEVSTPVNTP